MKILCIEDGSVDLNAIKNLKNGDYIVYRQNSNPPFVLEIDESFNKEKQRIKNEIINDSHFYDYDIITMQRLYIVGEYELDRILNKDCEKECSELVI